MSLNKYQKRFDDLDCFKQMDAIYWKWTKVELYYMIVGFTCMDIDFLQFRQMKKRKIVAKFYFVLRSIYIEMLEEHKI